jgi:phage terminase large subunit-like protein
MPKLNLMLVAVSAFALGGFVFHTPAVVGQRAQQKQAWQGGLWVDENLDSGRFFCLSDGSIWETDSLERLNVSLWLPMERVAVVNGERLVPEKKTAKAAKLYPNDLKPKQGARKGQWLRSKSGGGRILELSDGTLWEVNSLDRIKARLWLTMEKITVTDDVKLENTSRDPVETAGVKRLK